MNTLQVYNYFKNKKDVPSPYTDCLVQAGYQQESGGYIDYAKEQGIDIDYKKSLPSQYWHLIECYCKRTEDNKVFGKNILCGELILWMAEVSQAVDSDTLNDLVNKIIKSGVPRRRYKSSTKPPVKYPSWGKEIQEVCFDKIVQKVEAALEHFQGGSFGERL